MFMPTMSEPRTQRVQVPYLSGGINPGSVGEAVSDTQLTDCKNVWFKGGEVITRPKLETVNSAVSDDFDAESMQSVYSHINGKKVKVSVDKNLNYIIMSADNSFFDTGRLGINAVSDIKFLLYTGTGKVNNSLGVFLLLEYYYTDAGQTFHNRLVSELYQSGNIVEFKVYELNEYNNEVYIPQVILNGLGNYNTNLPRTDEAEFPQTTQPEGFNLISGAYKCSYTTDGISDSFYLPTPADGVIKISVNGMNMAIGNGIVPNQIDEKTIGFTNVEITPGFYKENSDGSLIFVKTLEFNIDAGKDTSDEVYYIDGKYIWYSKDGQTRKERLYYRCKFNCKVDRETGVISFPFMLQDEMPLFKASNKNITDRFQGGKTLLAEKTNVLTDEQAKVSVNTTGAYVIYCDDTSNSYTHTEGEYTTYFYNFQCSTEKSNLVLPRNGSINNNLDVTVYNSVDEASFNKVINCNISEYYGGTVGINYGTRSFVSGFDNKIYFSDIDNPLYFPENCYISIGNKNEKVTALSKQGGYLVIFKENSIYYTYEQEVENENLTESLTNQSVIDITAQYIYRTFTLNSEIGCDLPNTIQLCMNKLIFANTDGNVYVLNSLSNYSERNLFIVSGLIKDRLQKFNASEWKAAFCVDYSGYYMLFVDDMGFVLDYNRNSFKYVGSYTSDSNVRKYGLFSWWIWQFPKYLKFGVATDNSISLILSQDGKFELCTLTDEPETDCESYIVSKFFDFSIPDMYKGIEKLQLTMGNDYDSTIWLEHLTDGGEIASDPIEIYKTGDRGKANYLKGKVSYPNIKLCRQYGFKITAEGGPMALSSVIINYSVKGSVKNGI